MTDGARTRTRRPDVRSDQGVVRVRRVMYELGDEPVPEEEVEHVDVPAFHGDVEAGRVRVGAGVTYNTTGFNYVRVDVSCELPCYPEISELDRAHEVAARWVSSKLEAELAAMNERSDVVVTEGSAQAEPQPYDDNGSGIRPIMYDAS